MGGKGSKEVVMTPLKGTDKEAKIIKIERFPYKKLDKKNVQHIAGGPYKGIIVHKAVTEKPDPGKPTTLRDFFAYVADPKDEDTSIKEKRQLRFWFQKKVKEEETQTDKFLQELLNPKSFPKDYIGFVKRILNLLNIHKDVRKLELEMRPARPGDEDDAYILRSRIVPKTISFDGTGPSQEDQRVLQDGSAADGGQITNGRTDSAQSPYGSELEQKNKRLQNGISQDDHLKNQDGVDITIHEAVPRDEAALAASTPTGTYLRHHDKSPRDSTARDSREGAGSPGDRGSRGDRDSSGYPGDRGSRGFAGSPGDRGSAGSPGDRGSQGYAGSPGDRGSQGYAGSPGDRGSQGYGGSPGERGSKEYYPTQEDIANEERRRGAKDQYGSPNYQGAGYRDPHGESRTPGSRDSYGAPGTRDSYGKTPGSRDSYGSPDSRSPGSGYSKSPTQEDEIFQDRSRLSYTSQGSTPGGTYRDSAFVRGRDQRLSSKEQEAKSPREKTSGASPFTRASFGTTFGKDTSEIHDISGDGRTQTTVTTTTRTITYRTGDGEGKIKINKRGQELIWITKKQRILTALEDSFPNVLKVQDLIKNAGFKQKDMIPVAVMLRDLVRRGLIQEVEKGIWMRTQMAPPTPTDSKGLKVPFKKKHDIRMVQNMPTLLARDQPVIAIITRLYCEKLAVDAMIENKITYVRYKTEGEGQVYTIGDIGNHKVVSTKLPRVGYEQGAKTSAGNTVTRMLGIFSRVELVIVVGVGGSIPGRPNNTVERGDVVVSQPEFQGGPIYVHCTGTETDSSGNVMFQTAGWSVKNDVLDNIVTSLRNQMDANSASRGPWDQYLDEGMRELEGNDVRFYKPWSAGDTENPDSLKVHYGVVGCGQMLNREETVRRDFALTNDVLAVDAGYHAVMESIEGSRKDAFLVIRGITDFKDGMMKKDFQPFASLGAAAYMKSVILALPDSF